MQATIKIHNITPDRIEELQEESLLLAISGGTSIARQIGYAVGQAIANFIYGNNWPLASD
jgi:hypothetical protein